MYELMVLGGSRYAIPLIKKAQELGAYVITADYLPNNIAHKYSDEYVNVSIVEKEMVLKEALARGIDGIVSFACDPGVVTAAYVADKMGLPSCGPYESVCILQNKRRFRDFLRNNSFNVPYSKGYTSIDDALNDAKFFQWPVIVKPTDSAGSKGVNRVDALNELYAAAEYALSFSRSGEFIVEEYIEPIGFASDTDSFSVSGSLKFVSFNSQRFDSQAVNPYTPAGYSWPSKMPKSYQDELTNEIQRLLTLLDMDTSIYNIETRVGADGKAYIMECSPRGGGNRLAECLEYATGVNLIDNTVRAALGMELKEISSKTYDGFWAEMILHSEKDGMFEELWVDKSIENSIVEKDLWVKKGFCVRGFSAANESIGTVIMRFSDENQMNNVMNNIQHFVKVITK